MSYIRPLFASLLLLSPSALLAESTPFDKPLSIGASTFTLGQKLTANSLNANIAGLDLSQFQDQIGIDNEISITGVHIDYWLKPYLNVAAQVGSIDGETKLNTSAINTAALPMTLPPISIKYNGLAYNLSATLAMGYENFFSTLTYTYSRTSLDNDSEVSASSLMPAIGMKTQYGAFRLGALSVKADESHKGSIDITGLGSIPYEASLKTDDTFNYFLGYSHTFKNDIQVIAEAGISGEDYYSLKLLKRF